MNKVNTKYFFLRLFNYPKNYNHHHDDTARGSRFFFYIPGYETDLTCQPQEKRAREALALASSRRNLSSADLLGLEDQTSLPPAGASHSQHIHSGQHHHHDHHI